MAPSTTIKYAVICASNQNRSMEAHHILAKKGLDIVSFGTGSSVKLPGPSADRPNVYPFGTPYDQMYRELDKRDHNLYTQNGVLTMLDRNRNIKEAPQRFQDCINSSIDIYKNLDVIITCEERCFDAVMEELMNRSDPAQKKSRPTHVVNFEIKDTPEGAAMGARLISQFTTMLEEQPDFWLDNFDDILEEVSKPLEFEIVLLIIFSFKNQRMK